MCGTRATGKVLKGLKEGRMAIPVTQGLVLQAISEFVDGRPLSCCVGCEGEVGRQGGESCETLQPLQATRKMVCRISGEKVMMALNSWNQ
jgi:hypothetical protein